MGCRRAFAALMGSVAAFSAGSSASAACHMGLLAEAPLHRSASGQLYVSVQVNGHDVEAGLATESQESGIAGYALAKFGLHQHPVDGVSMVAAKSMDFAYATTVETIKLGGLTFRNSPLWVNGHPEGSRDDAELVLGARFFAQTDVEFDLQHNTLRLFKPTGCKDDEVLYWGGAYGTAPLIATPDGDNALQVEVKLNGVPVQAQLASGWGFTMVSRATANRVGGKQAADASAPVETRYLTMRPEQFDSFTLDQEVAKNLSLAVGTMKEVYAHDSISLLNTYHDIPPMLLGADFIGAHRLLIANSQRKIYFTYAGGPLFKPATAGASSDWR